MLVDGCRITGFAGMHREYTQDVSDTRGRKTRRNNGHFTTLNHVRATWRDPWVAISSSDTRKSFSPRLSVPPKYLSVFDRTKLAMSIDSLTSNATTVDNKKQKRKSKKSRQSLTTDVAQDESTRVDNTEICSKKRKHDSDNTSSGTLAHII